MICDPCAWILALTLTRDAGPRLVGPFATEQQCVSAGEDWHRRMPRAKGWVCTTTDQPPAKEVSP